MSLQRKAIREALVACLKDETSAGDAVESNRGRPAKRFGSESRAITIYYADEDAGVSKGSEAYVHEYKRTIELAVEMHAARRRAQGDDGDETDDAVDELGQELECVILQDTTLGGAAPGGGRYLRTEFDFSARGRQLIGQAAMVWEFVFYTSADVGAGPQSLTPFQRGVLDIDAQPPQGEVDTDDVTVDTSLPQT